MPTRIDHVVIAVPRLTQGIDAYTRLGFTVHPGGVHPGRGTQNAIPPPARGVRNTGEQAMLVGPGDACGAYIGFAGPV